YQDTYLSDQARRTRVAKIRQDPSGQSFFDTVLCLQSIIRRSKIGGFSKVSNELGEVLTETSPIVQYVTPFFDLASPMLAPARKTFLENHIDIEATGKLEHVPRNYTKLAGAISQIPLSP
ncbi:MAG: hypothetical protein AAB907_03255, partial [Patescibacteria group bacterium]